MKALILFAWQFNLLWATCAYGQAIPVLTDTNQLFLFPSVKVEWRTNLFTAETVQFVATNWVSVEEPKRLVLPNGTLATMTKQEAHMVTNIEHHLTYQGETRIWKKLQTFGPAMETRNLVVAAPPEAPALVTPNRQQR